MERHASANAAQSICNPLALPSCSPSAITLERQSTTVPKTSKARTFMEAVGGWLMLFSLSRDLSAHRKFERIIVQRFAAVWFHDHGSAELKAGFKVARDRIGLDHMHHVFDE